MIFSFFDLPITAVFFQDLVAIFTCQCWAQHDARQDVVNIMTWMALTFKYQIRTGSRRCAKISLCNKYPRGASRRPRLFSGRWWSVAAPDVQLLLAWRIIMSRLPMCASLNKIFGVRVKTLLPTIFTLTSIIQGRLIPAGLRAKAVRRGRINSAWRIYCSITPQSSTLSASSQLLTKSDKGTGYI